MGQIRTNTTDRLPARQGTFAQEVFSVTEDMPAPVSGDILLESILYAIKAPLVSADAVLISDTFGLRLATPNRTTDFWQYTGALTQFRTLPNEGAGTVDIQDGFIIHNNPAAVLFDVDARIAANSLSGKTGVIFTIGLVFVFNPGSLRKFSLLNLQQITFNNLLSGISLVDNTATHLTSLEFNSLGVAADAMLKISGVITTVKITLTSFLIGPAEKAIRIDPGIPDDSRVTVTSCDATPGVPLFDTTGLAGRETGTFTAVSNNSIASTTINSVSAGTVFSDGNVARFNYTVGPFPLVGQQVVISGFVTNTNYNSTSIITAVGAGYFEIETIYFVADEVGGSFLSNSVTLADIGTTLVDGDTLVVDTDMATDYDGGSYVYGVLADSFHINRTWTQTRDGTWSTSGLDQKDPRVLATGNPQFVDSQSIASGIVNSNPGGVTIFGANNVFVPLVFDQTLEEGVSTERWKMIDEITGTFEYTGNEPFVGSLTFDVSLEKIDGAGNTANYTLKATIDYGAGFVDLPELAEEFIYVNNDFANGSKTVPIEASKGDKVRIEAACDVSANNMQVNKFTLNIRG